MEQFCTVPGLGTLTVDTVFVYYDEPQVFICNSSAGVILLVIKVDENRWLATPILHSTKFEIEMGDCSFQEAVLNAKDGVVFEITCRHGIFELEVIDASEIPASDLPCD